jgi:hypothetical protein
MKVAILQRAEQNQAWEDQSASLDSDQVSEWSKEVERWENDPSEPNPFEPRSTRLLLINLGINIQLICLYSRSVASRHPSPVSTRRCSGPYKIKPAIRK